MEFLMGIFVGYLLFKKEDDRKYNYGEVCKSPTYPRPKRPGGK